VAARLFSVKLGVARLDGWLAEILLVETFEFGEYCDEQRLKEEDAFICV
jgi:hypothetical protein